VFTKDVSYADAHHLMFPGNPVESFSRTHRRQGSEGEQKQLNTSPVEA